MHLFKFSLCYAYIFHKMLLLLNNHLDYFKDIIFECFLRKYNKLWKKNVLQQIMMECLTLEEQNWSKEISNLFGLKKLNYTAIKDVRNILD